jgi:hypothetical protein
MNLLNRSGMQAALTTATDPTAQEHVVVVVKGTFLIPDDGGSAVLAPKEAQAPLIMADTFTGPPGLSAPVLEADFARHKPFCDVLVNGTAYAPQGRPTERCKVGVKFGSWQKVFDVVGDRVWRGRAVLGPSMPEPFLTMPVSYDLAYGGMDDTDAAKPAVYLMNPIGRGYGLARSGERLLGKPVPNMEDPREPIRAPWGNYKPVGLGPVHRSWQPRLGYAGTYDQNWLDNVFPFLPTDFDDRHYQAAPEDQQVQEPAGGEEIVLLNLTPGGRLKFYLPVDIGMPIVFFPRHGESEAKHAVLDTVVISPDVGHVYLIWRCTRLLRRNVFEVDAVLAGRASRAWWRARQLGKIYYSGLGALVREKNAGEDATV